MRYLVLFIVFFGRNTVYAQAYANQFPPGSEKYFCIDSNSYFRNGQLDQIKDSLRKLQKEAEAANDQEFVLSLRLVTYLKEYQQNSEGADTTEYRMLRLAVRANEQNMKRLEADVLQALGDLYSRNNEQQSAAIEQYSAAYAIYKSLNDIEFPSKKNYTYNFGLIFYKYQDYEQAIIVLREALYSRQYTRFGVFEPIANTIGLCYRNMKQYDSAIYYFQRVHDTAANRNEQVWVGIAQGNIGISYFYQKKYAKAEPLLKNDIAHSLANSNIKNAVNSMVVLATIYYEQGKYDDAEKLLLKALAYCHQKTFWRDYNLAENIYELLYKIYGRMRQFPLSQLYADSALMAKDSAVNRYNALTQSRSYEKQNFIRKKLADEKKEIQAKLDQLKKFDQQQMLYKFIIGFLIVVLIAAIIVNRYRTNLRNIATSLQDAPEIVVQKMSIVIISIATSVAALVWTALYYYYYGLCIVTVLPFVYFLLVVPSLIIYFFTKKQAVLVNVQLFCIFFITLSIELTNGGFKGGVVILWSFLAPVGALMYQGIKNAAVWMVLFILSVIGLSVFNEYLSASYRPIPETAQFMFDCMNILGPVIVIYFSMQFFVKSVIRDGRLLQENNLVLSNTLGELKTEKQKSDDLLLNILPEEVAEELKTKGTTTARHYDNVTVLFTDFVNFTEAGERMNPQGLVDELHACFKAFDEIMGKYNIEKIKTVGDAYLAVCGLPTADPKHAENIVNAAQEINAFMQDRQEKFGKSTFKVRLGVHSGSVVAGIVGVKKFAYDIWGDTVNTAARMEQHGAAGKINISQTTYELVKDKFNCEYRGEVEAKGKGVMKMYFVNA